MFRKRNHLQHRDVELRTLQGANAMLKESGADKMVRERN